jgi:two-component system nitrate/nitrite response regulator NarL
MKLLIIDDHPMTGAGLKSLLQSHYPQAQIKTLNEFSAAEINTTDWDYIFLDMHLPGYSFRELLDALTEQINRIILISAYPEPDAVELARQRGVRGLLPKNIDIEHILDGFQRIQHGENIFLNAQDILSAGNIRSACLTDRQRDILDTLLNGLSNKQIARKFSISEHTVKEHVSAILASYGVRNRLELLLQHRPPVI